MDGVIGDMAQAALYSLTALVKCLQVTMPTMLGVPQIEGGGMLPRYFPFG